MHITVPPTITPSFISIVIAAIYVHHYVLVWSMLFFRKGAAVAKWLYYSPPNLCDIGFDSRRGRSWIFARWNRTGRCCLSAGFLWDLSCPFIQTLLYTHLASPPSVLATSRGWEDPEVLRQTNRQLPTGGVRKHRKDGNFFFVRPFLLACLPSSPRPATANFHERTPQYVRPFPAHRRSLAQRLQCARRALTSSSFGDCDARQNSQSTTAECLPFGFDFLLRKQFCKDELAVSLKTLQIMNPRSGERRGDERGVKCGEIWAALNIEVLRADEGDYGAATECNEGEIHDKTRRPVASSRTLPTCENPGATPPEVEPGSPNRTTTPPRPRGEGSGTDLVCDWLLRVVKGSLLAGLSVDGGFPYVWCGAAVKGAHIIRQHICDTVNEFRGAYAAVKVVSPAAAGTHARHTARSGVPGSLVRRPPRCQLHGNKEIITSLAPPRTTHAKNDID
ncbi:hypothetical protein PR048_003407 [Dryococelus australis]|uniref:Uncharacterized protein n=1 Tax=Dryococelus australis TaxID=614101 RepID=A0ABQ9IN04_9NEOP|nr:hypothetical protein PR048_003407 [Dryococelus australis]